MRTLLSCCLLLASLGAGAEEAPVIGRLFAPATGSSTPASGNRLRVDGAIARSSGKNTVWINGQAQTENSVAAPRTQLDRIPSVRLEGGHEVRVGDALDRESGKRLGLLPDNAVAKGK